MRKEKRKKKENSTEVQKPNLEAEVYNNNKSMLNIHKYTHKQNQNSSTKIQYIRLTQ